MAFDEAFGEWEARAGDCRPSALVQPERGLAEDMATVLVGTETTLQGAWSRLRQRKREKPDPSSPWHWLSPRNDWILLKMLVDKLKLPRHAWTSVDSYWCPYYDIGTLCTTDTHVTFIPPEDGRDKERTPLDSLAAVRKWTTDFPEKK